MMKTIEEKREQFLDMQEHPEKYTADELQTMLDDKDMSEDIAAFEVLREAELRNSSDITDEEIGAELGKFLAKKNNGGARRLLRIAAMFIGCVFVAGIAFAAIRMVMERTPMLISNGDETETTTQTTHQTDGKAIVETAMAETNDSIVRFEEAELQTVVNTVAKHYGVEARYDNETVRHIKLFLVWNKQKSLGDLLKVLNAYDRFSIELEDKTLVVK